MKRTSIVKQLIRVSALTCLTSLAMGQGGIEDVKDRVFDVGDYWGENPQSKNFTTVNISSGYYSPVQSTVSIYKNGSLTAQTVNMRNGSGEDYDYGKGAYLQNLGGKLKITSLVMTGSHLPNAADQGMDLTLSLKGGETVIDSIHTTGSSYIYIGGGKNTFGNVDMGRGGTHDSHFSAGMEGSSTIHLNGSISTGTFTMGSGITAISIGDALLAQNVKGVVTVFSYDKVSTQNGAIDGVPDTLLNSKELLELACKSYTGTDYDLSQAVVTIHYEEFYNDAAANGEEIASYTTGGPIKEGKGYITIEGVKPIPEPSSATLGLLGLSALLLRRKRRA